MFAYIKKIPVSVFPPSLVVCLPVIALLAAAFVVYAELTIECITVVN